MQSSNLDYDLYLTRHICPQQIKWHIYHGAQRRRKALELMTYDIILTTYDTVVGDESTGPNDSNDEAGILHACEWHRVVLDEGEQGARGSILINPFAKPSISAHLIRNASSKRHRALSTIKARHRWCLTGSPLFNQVEDLGALLTFLKAYPFDSASYFNLQISAPLRTNPEKALSILRKLFRCVSLRRTKDAVVDDLQLKPRFDKVTEVQLNRKERRQYDELKRSLSYFFHTDASSVDNAGSGSKVLQTITRLRQFCNHGPNLLPRELQTLFADIVDEGKIRRALMTGSKTCDNCDDQASSGDLRKIIFRTVLCGHTICSRCLPEEQISQQSCPLCFSSEASKHLPHNAHEPRLVGPHHKYQPSSKVSALLENLFVEQKVYPTVKRYFGIPNLTFSGDTYLNLPASSSPHGPKCWILSKVLST